MIRLVIFGSRTVPASRAVDVIDYAFRDSVVNDWHLDDVAARDIEVVCGMAKGPDLAGYQWALRCGYRVAEFRPDWERHGKRAGFVRNREMAQYATHGIGIWHGESNGTANMAAHLLVLGKPVVLVEWWP
jgi:hypothetical protein